MTIVVSAKNYNYILQNYVNKGYKILDSHPIHDWAGNVLYTEYILNKDMED